MVSVTRMNTGNKSHFYELTTNCTVFPSLMVIILYIQNTQGVKWLTCCKIFFISKSLPFLVKILLQQDLPVQTTSTSSFAGAIRLLRSDLQVCVTVSMFDYKHTGWKTLNKCMLNFLAHLIDWMFVAKKKIRFSGPSTFQKDCVLCVSVWIF